MISILCISISVNAKEAKNVALKANTKPTIQEPFKFQFTNGISLKLYGQFDLLTYYDTTSPFLSDWLAFVYPSNNYDGQEDSYSMSVRASPIGFTFNYPEALWGGDINGKAEVDFVGGFTTGASGAYSPLLRLKQAWVSWDSKHFGILAGQTFGVFMPLFPDVGSWIALGTSGNPWIRLPQIKFTTKFDPIKFVFSVNRPMGANEAFNNSVDDIISDGEQSAVPLFMARLGFKQKFGPVTVSTGASGVYGREKIHRDDATAGIAIDKELNIWMAGYDLALLSKYIDFKAEFFGGDNVNTFFAGIVQGVNTTTNDATVITTIGGWGQFTVKPIEKLYFNVGAGIDNPMNGDLTAAQRSSNLMVYGNINYKLIKNWKITAEPSYMRTGYKGGNSNDNIRGMIKTSFKF